MNGKITKEDGNNCLLRDFHAFTNYGINNRRRFACNIKDFFRSSCCQFKRWKNHFPPCLRLLLNWSSSSFNLPSKSLLLWEYINVKIDACAFCCSSATLQNIILIPFRNSLLPSSSIYHRNPLTPNQAKSFDHIRNDGKVWAQYQKLSTFLHQFSLLPSSSSSFVRSFGSRRKSLEKKDYHEFIYFSQIHATPRQTSQHLNIVELVDWNCDGAEEKGNLLELK